MSGGGRERGGRTKGGCVYFVCICCAYFMYLVLPIRGINNQTEAKERPAAGARGHTIRRNKDRIEEERQRVPCSFPLLAPI